MALSIDKLRRDLRRDARTTALQAIGLAIAAFAAGAAWVRFCG